MMKEGLEENHGVKLLQHRMFQVVLGRLLVQTL